MRKRWIIAVCWFVLAGPPLRSQVGGSPVVPDSLQSPEQLPGLLRLAKHYLSTNPNLAATYAEKAESLAIATGKPEARARALKVRGDAQQYTAQYLAAESIYLELLPLYPEPQYPMERSETLNELGNVNGYMGRYELALRKYLESYTIKTNVGDHYGLAKLSNNIGLLYYRLGNYDKAMEYYEQALNISKDIEAPQIEASTLTNLGFLLSQQEQHQKALDYQQRASDAYRELNDRLRWSNSFINIGYEYEQLGDYSTAVQHYLLAAEHSAPLGHQAIYTDALNKLSGVYIKMKQYEQALQQLQKAYPLAKALNDPAMLNEINLSYSEYYTQTGQYEQALEYYRQWAATKDSLVSQHNRNRISELEILHQTEQKESEIVLLEQKNARQRLFILFASVTALLLLISGILLWSRSRIRIDLLEKEQKLQQEENKRKELEIENERNRAERLQMAQQLKEEENKRLQSELLLKNSELSSVTMLIYQKNESLTKLKSEIDKLLAYAEPEKAHLRQLKRSIQQNIRLDDDWERFRKHFEQVHPGFFDYLSQHFPKLSQTDRRHCAYIRMNLSTKEISSLLNINPSSVQRARVRLKKKMDLEKEINLMAFIQSI